MPSWKCKIVKIEKFNSKKGNLCANVSVIFEDSIFPVNVLVFNRVEDLPAVGSISTVTIGSDRFYNARVELVF